MILKYRKNLLITIILLEMMTTSLYGLDSHQPDLHLSPASSSSSLKPSSKKQDADYELLKYTFELYLKYYELLQDNIFQNAAQKKKAIQNFNILKSTLLEFMNKSEKNRQVMYKLLVQFMGKNKKGKRGF